MFIVLIITVFCILWKYVFLIFIGVLQYFASGLLVTKVAAHPCTYL
jgi:hypothetical protein